MAFRMAAINTELEDALHDEAATLDRLNDDCILMICDYLPIYDLLNLSSVSTRLNPVARRSLNVHLTIDVTTIRKNPLTFLIKFASFIKHLKVFIVTANIKTVDDISAHCSNLTYMGFKKMWEELFADLLSRLNYLQPKRMNSLEAKEWVQLHKDIEAVLNCCYNLTELTLGCRDSECMTDFDLFLNIKFPKLLQLSILVDGSEYLSNAYFVEFLQSNTKLKSIRMMIADGSRDISGILDFPIEEIVLWTREDVISYTVIPKLHRMSHLKHLKMSIWCDRHMFIPFRESWKDFQQLTTLKLHYKFQDQERSFDDEDLIHISDIPNLSVFELYNRKNNLTLSGILKTIEKCAKLTHFGIIGFQQHFASADGWTLLDEDVHDRFCKYSRSVKWTHLYVRRADIKLGKYYQFYPAFTNSFWLFKSFCKSLDC